MRYLILFVVAFLTGVSVGNSEMDNSANAQVISEERMGPGEPKTAPPKATPVQVKPAPKMEMAPVVPPKVTIAPGYPRLVCWTPKADEPLIFEHPHWVFRPDGGGTTTPARITVNSWTVWKRGTGNGERPDMLQLNTSGPEGDFIYLNTAIPCMYMTAPVQNNVRN